MRKLISLIAVALLVVAAEPALAQFEDELEDKLVRIGEPLEYVSDIEEGQWYLVATNYTSQESCFLRNYNGYIFESEGTSAVLDGTLAENAEEYLVRFIPVDMEDFDYQTFYMQFATGEYAHIRSESGVVYTYEEFEEAKAMCFYNVSDSAYHFGMYAADEYRYSLWAGGGPGAYVWGWYTGVHNSLGGRWDFSIYPVSLELPDLEGRDLALWLCQNALNKYRAYVGTLPTGDGFGYYDADAVAAFEAAVDAASACDGDDADSLTEEDLLRLTQDIKDTYQAAVDSYKGWVEPDDGYYYIYQAGYTYSIEPALYVYNDENNTTYAYWGELEADAHYLWHLTAQGNHAYDVRNMSNNYTFNEIVYYEKITLSAESDVLMLFDYSRTNADGEYIFNMRTTNGEEGGLTYIWAAGTSSGAGTYGSVWGYVRSYDNGARWKLVPVSDEEAEEILGAFDTGQEERYNNARALITEVSVMLEIAYDGGNATSQAVAMGSVYTDLVAAIEAAEEEGSGISAQTYNQLVSAYEAFLAAYVDPTQLRQLMAEAEAVAAGIVSGSDPGTWTDMGVASVLRGTLAEATAYDANGRYSASETAAYTEALQTQLAAVTEAGNHVSEGKWYEIRFATEQEVDDHGWGDINYGAATDSSPELYGKYLSVAELVVVDSVCHIEATSDRALEGSLLEHGLYFQAKGDIKYEDYAKFRFINVGDTAYMVQNKATGLFLRSNGTDADEVTLSLNPSLFTVSALGYGENLLTAKTLGGDSHGNLYGWVYQNKLITWATNTVGTPAGLFIEDVDEEVASDYSGTDFYMSVAVGTINLFCYPVALTAYDGIAYGVDVDGTTVNLSPLDDNEIAAGQPFVYIDGELEDYEEEGDERETVAFAHGYDLEKNPKTVGRLVGNYYEETVGSGKAIADGNGFTFTKFVNSTVEPNSAYIDGFGLNDEITVVVSETEYDGIAGAVATVAKPGNRIYSIDGRYMGEGGIDSVRSLSRGIYIVGGRKVIVR